MRTHEEIDERSLALHQLIAEKIRHEPALLAKVETTLARWRSTVCSAPQPYLAEWSQLVSSGVGASLKMATEDTEHARALRQCSPFTGILSNQERFTFLKTWRGRNAA